MKKTLLILAAGFGTRYGGLKQLESFGPNGELLMEYSIFDALKAGFDKIVFVVHKNFVNEFKEIMIPKLDPLAEIIFVTQNIDDLPGNINKNIDRHKPWGTAHAVWATRDVISEPFLIINADDYYGSNVYHVASRFLEKQSKNFAVLGYRLEDTLSSYGGVNRGICFNENNPEKLSEIIEVKGIKKDSSNNLSYNKNQDFFKKLNFSDAVSMNMFCLTPNFFNLTEIVFYEFLNDNQNLHDAELLIPHVIDYAINNTKIDTLILDAKSDWFGVTYKADRIMAVYKIEDKIKLGVYPEKLFEPKTLLDDQY